MVRRPSRSLSLLAVLLLGVTTASQRISPPYYEAQDLGSGQLCCSSAVGLDDAGRVAGTTLGDPPHAFLWDGRTTRVLDQPSSSGGISPSAGKWRSHSGLGHPGQRSGMVGA